MVMNFHRDDENREAEVIFFTNLIKAIFTDIRSAQSKEQYVPTEEDLRNVNELENKVQHLEYIVMFLKLMDSAIPYMKDLIESVTMGDMQEAVEFLTAAYQFKIERSQEGIYGGYFKCRVTCNLN